MMSDESEKNHDVQSSDGWPAGWDGHKVAQLRRLADLPFSQKLEWLDAAQRMVNQLRRTGATPAAEPPPK